MTTALYSGAGCGEIRTSGSEVEVRPVLSAAEGSVMTPPTITRQVFRVTDINHIIQHHILLVIDR